MNPESSEARLIDRRIALAREWDELLEQVRALKGFEDFLLPPPIETLLPAAAEGPVVMVNVSAWRCDALIVTTEGVRAVPLPGLSLASAQERLGEYLRVVTGDGLEEREAVLTSTLGWLWDAVAEPVLDALGYRAEPAGTWPRVWWCPTGPLTLLPLHAAGHHGPAGGGRTVMDRVVSSYTPTLRALLEARGERRGVRGPGDARRAGDEAGEGNGDGGGGRMLIVAVPDAPGAPHLENVVTEQEVLTRLFPGDRHTLLAGDDAVRDRVRAELPRHRWVHFSGHGGQDLTDPSQGGLLLRDGKLTVTDIGAAGYQGEFAFLSACKTATGGTALPDEAITITAALHYTGYRQVIGTLWSVHDRLAVVVADSVYQRLTTTGRFLPGDAARALHRAVRPLRTGFAARPSLWVPFTHTGP
ncbi:CHAT domain-containing protein [Sphaerisporangium aureirubrum]|uniref:CHAT domain-containing protein n=1 Tax=Sphaerisporangium aureirubrum TaxID=1544736 RepID=A0ABW1NIM0_9ACTN